MGLIRSYNWESILNSKIEESRSLQFEYGKNDCTIWASDIIRSYTNLDWKATWKTKIQALREHSKMPMQEQVNLVLGPYSSNLLCTRRGDLVQKDIGIDAKLGICLGSKVAFLKEGEGLCFFSLRECIYSWRI